MASQISTEKMLKFDAFKAELHALLEGVLDEAKIIQSAAADPVVLDRSWILNKMKEHMVEGEYVIEPGAMQIARGLGNLRKLPRELRDQVYEYIIIDGHVDIMRASKQTYEETKTLVPALGVFRLAFGLANVGLEYRVINPPMSQAVADNIQNLSIRVNFRNRFIDRINRDLPTLHMFHGPTPQRKNCVVKIECEYSTWDMYPSRVVPALADFTGFELVSLELDLEWGGEPWPDTMEEFYKDRIWQSIQWSLNGINEELEPTLGTAESNYDEDGMGLRLTFHPRK